MADRYDRRTDAELASLLRALAADLSQAEAEAEAKGMGHLTGPCSSCWDRDHGIEPELVLHQAANRLEGKPALKGLEGAGRV